MATVAACLIALAFGYFGSMPLAGPVAVIVVSRAARGHFGEALRVGLGAAIAEAVYAGVAFWGYTTLLARQPLLLPLSHGVTAVVLVVLGVHFAVWRPKDERDRREHKAGTVLLGFTVSAVNPTLLVTWGAAVAFLYSKGLTGMPAIAAAPFGACAGLGVAAWMATLVAVLRKYEGRLPRRLLTWTVRVLGAALVFLGVWSGVQLGGWLGRSRAPRAGAAVSLCCAECSRARWIRTSPSRRPSTSSSGTASPARAAVS
jgi:threonine/homoserine/homoserine lactone efflux protein